jgi:hypothetical protein
MSNLVTVSNSCRCSVARYTSLQQLENEVSMARIWGGVHYRTSTEVGRAMGKKVGEYVLQNYLPAVNLVVK